MQKIQILHVGSKSWASEQSMFLLKLSQL